MSSGFFAYKAEQIAVGLSLIVGMTALPSQVSFLFKNMGGGTLYVGGESLAIGSANGYNMGLSEAISLDGRATIYFTSAGATSIVHVLRGFDGTNIG